MLASEPTAIPPIEDQVLEAILAASSPAPAGVGGEVAGRTPAALEPSDDGGGTSASRPFPLCTLNSALCTLSPLSLASTLNIPLSKLLDILANPKTRSRIAAAQELRDLAFHQREQLAREKALLALESILDTTDDPIEKRRAATAILRRHSTRNPFWPKTPGSAGAATIDDDEDLDEDALPPRAPLPDPEYPGWCKPPRPGLIRLLTRLQDNHNPTPNAGLATLYNFKVQPKSFDLNDTSFEDYLKDPGQDAELTNFSCAIIHTPDAKSKSDSDSDSESQSESDSKYELDAASASGPDPNPNLPSNPNTHTDRITLHWPTHHRTIHLHFKNTGNPWAALWQIAHIDIGPKLTTADDSS